MANFPTSLDTYTANVDNVDVIYAADVNGLQEAVVALEGKVGIDGSAVTTTHDYKLSAVTGSNKAVPNNGATIATPTITGATITTSTINGVTITTAGAATDFLAANGTYQPGGIANGSTTVKGIFEAATSAEVTAGTATGATGAALAVTPDALAASTPVFNGSGLTNVSTGFLTSGAPGTTTTNATATVLTYSLAGGILSTNKAVRVRATVQVAIAATNNNATYTLAYGGTTLATFGYSGNSGTPTVTIIQVIDVIIMGSGATSTQRTSAIMPVQITSGSGGALVGGGVASSATSAIDSTSAQNITIACTAGASVTGTLLDYMISKVV